MSENIAYKAKFNRALEPIKVMLVNRRGNLTKEQWLKFVDKTMISVIHHPDQYLGKEIPERETLVFIVKDIFKEFITKEQYQ